MSRIKPNVGTTTISYSCPRCNTVDEVIYTRPSIKYGNVYYCKKCDRGGPTSDRPGRTDGHFYVGKNGVQANRWL